MHCRLIILGLLLAWMTNGHAGHGFMNSFGDIEWLPEPGQTPDQFGYRLDSWYELAQLTLASTAHERYTLSLEFAREKLAEIEAMVLQNKRDAAHLALARYRDHIDVAAQANAALNDPVAVEFKLHFASVLLQHQYIASVNYLDLPGTSRKIMFEAMEIAGAHYDLIAGQLGRKTKESLFFKEEEVRWSREIAEQADIQGL